MRKVFISVFITVLTFFFFSGCYDAIFQEIRTEVELNEGSISGFINNIVRFSAAGSGREFLIISDGNLYNAKFKPYNYAVIISCCYWSYDLFIFFIS